MYKFIFAVAFLALPVMGCNPQQTVAPAGREVLRMLPQATKAGTPFNVQGDGSSGISFVLSRPAPPGRIRILFAGKPLQGVAANQALVTATVPTAYLEKAGVYPVTILLPNTKTAMPAGYFTVE